MYLINKCYLFYPTFKKLFFFKSVDVAYFVPSTIAED